MRDLLRAFREFTGELRLESGVPSSRVSVLPVVPEVCPSQDAVSRELSISQLSLLTYSHFSL